mmetsp:Transcript_39108/g.75062  ORF Transcript_39108/g.75062 Transcript_39108/m.75062 type:complete len:85 (-) Transcript_39108:292-546(-)
MTMDELNIGQGKVHKILDDLSIGRRLRSCLKANLLKSRRFVGMVLQNPARAKVLTRDCAGGWEGRIDTMTIALISDLSTICAPS